MAKTNQIKPTSQSWRSGSVIGPWALRENNPYNSVTISQSERALYRLQTQAMYSFYTGADQLEHATPILNLCHGNFTD